MSRRASLLRCAAWGAGSLLLAAATISRASGVLVWTGLAAAAIAGLYSLRNLLDGLWPQHSGRRQRHFFRFLLAALSLVTALVVLEGFLAWQHRRFSAGGLADPWVIPPEWESEYLPPGEAFLRWRWHGHLHVQDEIGARNAGDWPPRREGVLRILALGDSVTFGQGVAEEDTWPEVLERHLSADYRVEVLNLGVPGYQSEDVALLVREAAPKLRPDIVLYGVCLNDFGPSQWSSETEGESAAFLQHGDAQGGRGVRAWFRRRTRVGKLVDKGLRDLAVVTGLSPGYWDEILEDFGARRERFCADVSGMNRFVRQAGRPPILAMVLEWTPVLEGRPKEILQAAEACLQEGGLDLVPAEGYLLRIQGRNLRVSRWEHHPGAEAQAIFAAEFERRLRALPLVARYRLGSGVEDAIPSAVDREEDPAEPRGSLP